MKISSEKLAAAWPAGAAALRCGCWYGWGQLFNLSALLVLALLPLLVGSVRWGLGGTVVAVLAHTVALLWLIPPSMSDGMRVLETLQLQREPTAPAGMELEPFV